VLCTDDGSRIRKKIETNDYLPIKVLCGVNRGYHYGTLFLFAT